MLQKQKVLLAKQKNNRGKNYYYRKKVEPKREPIIERKIPSEPKMDVVDKPKTEEPKKMIGLSLPEIYKRKKDGFYEETHCFSCVNMCSRKFLWM